MPNPRFPLYIPSKGRHEYMITSRALSAMGVHHYLVVEPQEVEAYQAAVNEMKIDATILPLDMTYKAKYELCDDLGLAKSTGAGPSRNFAWDHSITNGHDWHWVMDDNIYRFYRLNQNRKVPTSCPGFWAAMEDFALRYENVAMAGPNYESFIPRRTVVPPFVANTRIYSCNLIRNDVPHRWRGRYNEDTILSLDMLKGGWCTIQFNAFLQNKTRTQTIKGGNTSELYEAEDFVKTGNYSPSGTIAKSKMLVDVHPDVSRVVWKYRRCHHHVDYAPFKNQKLIRRPDIEIPAQPNEYGMQLVKNG